MATSIGVNFIGGNNAGGASVTGPAGVVSQSNWNNENTNASADAAIVTDDGASAGATLTWSSNNVWSTGAAGTNQNGNLMQGYLDDSATATTTVSLSNLPSSIAGTGSTPYNVILYIAGDTAGRGGNYTVNGTSAVLVNSGPEADGIFQLATPSTDPNNDANAGTGAVAGNYYAFTNVTGTTLDISTVGYSIGSNQRSPLDGFQVTTSPVPEPATLGLLGLGGLLLLGRRRRAT
jgi:hypothetical protein